MIYDVIIAGGGAAGLYCACGMDRKVNGLILENSSSPGQKLLISGGGMCNLSHGGSVKDFIPCYFEAGPKIRSCLYKYGNLKLMEFFRDRGLHLYIRDDGKIFPESEKAKDVLDALVRGARENGFEIMTGHKVDRISPLEKGSLWEVTAGGKTFRCRNLVIACGGSSFPKTGSDGSISGVLTRDIPGLSENIVKPQPALAPVYVEGYPYGGLSGVSFSRVSAEAFAPDGKPLAKITGPLLFAEKFLSGPVILHISRYLNPGCKLSINYLPDAKITAKEINGLLSESRKSPANTAAEIFGLPKSFTQLLEDESCGKLSAISRRLMTDTFTVSKVAGFDAAMATRGGVSLDAVSTKTFEVKSCPGLFIIGETLDVDGMTGGYNLQFAFSSAMAAAAEIGKTLEPFPVP
ncbi:MAG TPA: aminoacetone oxidase family FAD-binding enzyme [Candidatus Avanaerovorax faecigallinarum]|nr:aminoacetone oxidase family FAD-binding enzyme [Candidatus Avanaerovorax faecigallinarum]